MFKEKYKRDNAMINPSHEFLEKLKAEMKKEENLRKKESVSIKEEEISRKEIPGEHGSLQMRNEDSLMGEENLQVRKEDVPGKEESLKITREESFQKRHKTYGSRKMLATAAAIAIVVIGTFSYNKISNTQKNTIMQQTEISQNSGSTEKDGSIEDSRNSGNSSNSSNSSSSESGRNTGGSKDAEKNDLFSNSSWYDSGMSSEEIYSTFIKRISSQDDLKELNVSSTNDFTNGEALDESSVNKLADSLKNGRLISEEANNNEKNKDDSSSKENPKYYMADFNNGDIIKFVIYDGRYFECSDFEGTYSIENGQLTIDN